MFNLASCYSGIWEKLLFVSTTNGVTISLGSGFESIKTAIPIRQYLIY